jgi:MFS transporter, DHA1 family, inner membrane transport protein
MENIIKSSKPNETRASTRSATIETDKSAAGFGMTKLLTLTAGAFAVGTSEFLMMGTLPAVATDLGVSVSAAGQLVSAFALGIAIGGPALAGMTARFEHRRVLVGALLAFLLTNLFVALAPIYSLALVMRFLGGALGGLFYGVAFATAAMQAGVGKQGSAIATVLGGVTMATVLGSPLGAWIGQELGWRIPYGLIAVMTLAIAFAVTRLLPALPGNASLASGLRGAIDGLKTLLSVFGNRPLALMYLSITFINTGWFALYTYIAPYWTGVSSVTTQFVPAALLAYGVFSAIGGLWGGKLVNRSALRTLKLSVLMQAALLGALMFTAGAPITALALGMIWGLTAWVFVSAAQVRVVELAGPQADVASSVAVSAFNVGNAAGALLGGIVVATWGVSVAPIVSAVFVLLGLGTIAISTGLAKKSMG